MGQQFEAGSQFANDLQPCRAAHAQFAEPVFQLASVTSVRPDHFEPAKPQGLLEEGLGSISILQTSGMNDDAEDQSQGVDQQVTFSPQNLLACIEATLATLASPLNALAVDGRSRWGFFLPRAKRTRSRKAALICSQTPSCCHLLK